MTWTTPLATFTAGQVLTESHMNQLKTIGDVRASYTPTYASGITAIGNATVDAKYMQAGKLVIGHVHITVGSTTTFAAGNINVSLPVAAARATHAAIGTGYIFDNSVGNASRAIVHPVMVSASVVYLLLASTTTGGTVSNSSPFTWATNDILQFDFCYEAA